MEKNNVIEFKKKSASQEPITYKNYKKKLMQLFDILLKDESIPVKSPDEFRTRREFNIYVASLMRKYL